MSKKIAIFGASGFIGKRLYEFFSKKNEISFGTYHNSYRENLRYFDLGSSNLEGLVLDKVDYGIISTGINNINECERNKKRIHSLNVDNTKLLIERFFEKGITPIFISSDNVFDGKEGNYTELSKTNPINVYGVCKELIEDFIINSGESSLIIRPSKVFSLNCNDNTLISSIIKDLKDDKEIYCASDNSFSPICINDLVNVFDILMNKKLEGIYNLGSPESFSRFELAKKIKSQLEIKSGKIIPCLMKEFETIGKYPLKVNMNVEKIIKDTEYNFIPLNKYIRKFK